VQTDSCAACSDQLARCKDRLRVDIGHLSHPVYGAPELATALVENPAEYLPIVSGLGSRAGTLGRSNSGVPQHEQHGWRRNVLMAPWSPVARHTDLLLLNQGVFVFPVTQHRLAPLVVAFLPACSLSRLPSRRASASRICGRMEATQKSPKCRRGLGRHAPHATLGWQLSAAASMASASKRRVTPGLAAPQPCACSCPLRHLPAGMR
jgi:hypothetical protein